MTRQLNKGLNFKKANLFLEGEKIYLAPLMKKDISDEYVNWLNDEDVCKENSHATFPNTYLKTLKYIDSLGKSNNEIAFTIRWKNDDKHIGNAALQNINWVNRSLEIAILIGNKNYWNKGVGSEAYKLLIDYGFTRLNMNRISSGQTISNNGMISVCEKSGMKKEGTLREALYKNGKYVDAVIYSILLNDYSKRQTSNVRRQT